MKKLILIVLLAMSANVFACGSLNNKTSFFWFYDQKSQAFYLTDFVVNEDWEEKIGDSLKIALRHKTGNTVKINAVHKHDDGQQTVYNFTGKLVSMTKCLGSPQKVMLDEAEFQDYEKLPERYKEAMAQYIEKVLASK